MIQQQTSRMIKKVGMNGSKKEHILKIAEQKHMVSSFCPYDNLSFIYQHVIDLDNIGKDDTLGESKHRTGLIILGTVKTIHSLLHSKIYSM